MELFLKFHVTGEVPRTERVLAQADDLGLTGVLLNVGSPGVGGGFRHRCNAASRLGRALRREGVSFHWIVPVFHNPGWFAAHPLLRPVDLGGRVFRRKDWYAPVCPNDPEYIERFEGMFLPTLGVLEPEGVSFDFLRFPFFWEQERNLRWNGRQSLFCGCLYCRDAFNAGRVSGDGGEVEWSSPGEAWSQWRAGCISTIALRLSRLARRENPQVTVWIHIPPVTGGDTSAACAMLYGQEIAALSRIVDRLSPMLYHGILRRPLSWVRRSAEEFRRLAGTTSSVYPSVEWREPGSLRHSTMKRWLSARETPGIRGLVLFQRTEREA